MDCVLFRTRTLPWVVCIGLAFVTVLNHGFLHHQWRKAPYSPILPLLDNDGVNSHINVTKVNKQLHVIPIVPLLTDPKFNKSNFNEPSKLEERMLDFLESLQYTLNHKLVAEVHLLYDQDNMPSYITSKLGHHAKMTFRKVDDTYKPLSVFDYVHNNFLNKLVMVTNGDIYHGEGFGRIDYDVMMSKHLFYSPSRHGRQEKRCKISSTFCGTGYSGAHDTYIFIPTQQFPPKGLELLKRNKWDSWGTENTILYIYRNLLQYKVLNPCKVIFVYHNHCSNVRHTDRVRHQPKSFHAEPSDQLQ